MLIRFVKITILSIILAACNHTVSSINSSLGGASDSSDSQKTNVIVEGKFTKGKPAPNVVVTSFDGEEVDVSQWYGQKAIILDFWAGWCPFCIAEMPELQKAQELYSNDLVIIGVHRTDTESTSTGEKFAQDRDVSYLLVKDDGSLYRAAGGIGMPVAVFISKEGIVQEIKSGPKTETEIKTKIENLIQ